VPFALWTVAGRRWRLLAATAASIAAASLVAMSTNPAVFAQYRQLMASAPPTLTFESPNIATILRVAMGTAGSWPQFVPTALGAIGVGWWWYRRRAEWDWAVELPGLVLISCLLTSYGGWAFDLVVLLLPVVATTAIVVRSGRPALSAPAVLFAGSPARRSRCTGSVRSPRSWIPRGRDRLIVLQRLHMARIYLLSRRI
jgi:hypothetical protein